MNTEIEKFVAEYRKLEAELIKVMGVPKHLMDVDYKAEYYSLKESGLFWEFFPELTGDWETDKGTYLMVRHGNKL